MEHHFWHEKWEANELAFHMAGYNPALTDNWPALDISPGSRIFVPLCGDFFSLEPERLAGVDAVYDRASLIALPPDRRAQYVAHMKKLLRLDLQALLITLTYQDGQINPPPFRVFREEVEVLYDPWCDVELLQESETEVKQATCPQFAFRLRVR